MSQTLLENIHVVHVGASAFIANYADFITTNIVTDVVSLAEYNRATWLIIKGPGAVGTGKVYVESCDNATPDTKTDIGYTYRLVTAPDTETAKVAVAAASEFTTAASADLIYVVSVTAAQLYSTDKFVRLIIDEVNGDPQEGTVVCILSEPRYTQDTMLTAIA